MSCLWVFLISKSLWETSLRLSSSLVSSSLPFSSKVSKSLTLFLMSISSNVSWSTDKSWELRFFLNYVVFKKTSYCEQYAPPNLLVISHCHLAKFAVRQPKTAPLGWWFLENFHQWGWKMLGLQGGLAFRGTPKCRGVKYLDKLYKSVMQKF